MAKARSPGYPTIGLREAIEKIKLVYSKDYQNRMPRDVVASHMGYNSLNGKSLGVLSAVAKFGLLEGRGEENRVSDLALEIIAHAPGTPERAKAITEAASHPELFGDLDARFQGGKASDAVLRSYLITKKFIPQAADAAIRAYRETKALVNEETGGYATDSHPHVEAEDSEMVGLSPENALQRRPPVGPVIGAATPGEREFIRGQLGRDSGYRLLVSGEIGPKELAKIIRVLTLQKELLSDSDDESEGPSEQ
jgi:hypothetical protein